VRPIISKVNPMTSPAPPAAGSAGSPVRELAAQIYVELVGRVMLGDNKPNPVDLAKFCYKLADAFESIERDAQKEATAKMAKYDVKVDDMTSWKK
jgi:hypothetical protein